MRWRMATLASFLMCGISQQKHTAMLVELILCVDVYGDVQIPHSQRNEGGKFGIGGAITASVRDWNGVLKLRVLD